MRPDDLRIEVRQAILRVPRIPLSNALWIRVFRALYNLGSRTPLEPGVDIKKLNADGINVRCYTPQKNKSGAAILWFYGGGHIAGKPAHLNSIASYAARELGVTVMVPEYRLAPAHPYPANLDDGYKAWLWLVSNANTLGLDPKRLAIAGHSAGGGLAAALALLIRDAGGQQPRSQCLFYPMLDDRIACDRTLDSENHYIWNNKTNFHAWSAYFGKLSPGSNDIPEYAAAARETDLTQLPSTWIGICGLDLFEAQDTNYAKRLLESEVDCEVHRVEGVPHAFEVLVPDCEPARAIKASAIEFLRKTLN